MPVLSAGYILEEVTDYFSHKGHPSLLDQLAQMSLFELSSQTDTVVHVEEEVVSVVAIANQLISRGRPTRASLLLAEKILHAIFDTTEYVEKNDQIHYELPYEQMEDIASTLPKDNLFRLLEGRLSEEKKLLAQLLLTPIAVARIQKVLIQLMLNKVLDLSSTMWNILIIERDVPCATTAIEDLKSLLNHLFQLEETSHVLPKITLSVVPSEAFADTPLGQLAVNPKTISDLKIQTQKFDAVIDIALGMESFYQTPRTLKEFPFAQIRSVINPDSIVDLDFYGELEIAYSQLGQLNPTNQFFFHNHTRQEAIKYLFQNIFRLKQIPPGIPQILNQSLQHESLVVWYPNKKHQLQAMMLSALLMPGVSGVIYEGGLQALQDLEELKKYYIDIFELFTHQETKTTYQEKARNISQRLSKLFVTTASLFFDQHFQEVFEQEILGKCKFSQLIFQEAHSISEWSHYTSHLYAALAGDIRGVFEIDEEVPLSIYSGTMTYDVIEDICGEFGIEESAVITLPDEIYQNRFVNYSIIPVPYSESQALLANKEKSLVMVKYPVLKRLLENVPFEFGKKPSELFGSISQNGVPEYPFGGVIYDQHVSQPTGYHLESLSKYLLSEQYLDIEIFPFDPVNQSNEVGYFSSGYQHFINKLTNLLITNYSLGNSLNADHIRYTIHYHLPLSPENLYGETSFNIARKERGNAYILYHPTDLADNESKLLSQYPSSYIDEKGERLIKDEIWVQEIFEGISYPDNFIGHYLSAKLLQKLGINIRVRISQEQGELFVLTIETLTEKSGQYTQGKVFGSIYLPNLAVDVQTSLLVSHNEANHVLNTAVSLLDELCPDGEFANIILNKKEKGLSNFLLERKTGQGNIIISHQNEYLQRLTDLIKTEGNYEVNTDFLNRLLGEVATSADFIQALEREYPLMIRQERKSLMSLIDSTESQDERFRANKRLRYLSEIPEVFSLSSQVRTAIEQLYPRVRIRKDTLKLLSRMKIAGIIDKFDWEEHSRLAILYVGVYPNTYYTSKYTQLLKRYFGSESSAQWIGDFPEEETPASLMKFIIGNYLKFIHEYVGPRRLNATRLVAEMCKEGLKKGNIVVHEYTKQYFMELFSHRDFLPQDTKNNLESTEILDKYIQFITSPPKKLELGSEIAILKHLKKSCESVQTVLPRQNRVLIVLQAYAELLLLSKKGFNTEDGDEFQNEKFTVVKTQFTEGLTSLYNTFTGDQWVEIVDQLKTCATSFNSELGVLFDEVADTLMISYYRNWLTGFNNKFLDITN